MEKVYIYGLVDPRTGEIRYVGKTNNLKLRYNGHNKTKWIRDKKTSWVVGLKQLGLNFKMIVLEETDTDGWSSAERWWVEHLRSNGYNLTNLNNGGYGKGSMGDSTKEKLRLANLGKPSKLLGTKLSEEAKQNNRLAQQKLVPSQVREIRKILATDPYTTQNELAQQYGVHVRTIMNIVSGRTYSQYTKQDGLQNKIDGMKGRRIVVHRKKSLPVETVQTIRLLDGYGLKRCQIAKQVLVDARIVSNILLGKSYWWIK